MDLYLYQVSRTWEMKITWKLVRNSLCTIYLSEIHCKDVWQWITKWITGSGVVSTPSHVQMPQSSQAHLLVCTDTRSKAKHGDIATFSSGPLCEMWHRGRSNFSTIQSRLAGAFADSALHRAVFPPFKLRLENSRDWVLNRWGSERCRGAGSCADLLCKRQVPLAPCPVVRCMLASPPVDTGIPCLQQRGERKQGTFC